MTGGKFAGFRVSNKVTDIDSLADSFDQLKPEQAVTIATALTSQYPDKALGWTILAESHYRAGEYAAALRASEKAVQLSPNSASALSNLGVMLSAVDCLKDAEIALRRALQCDSEFIAAYVNLGSVLRELGRYAEAESLYRLAIAREPNHGDAHINFGTLLLEQGRPDEAERILRHAIQLRPHDTMAHIKLATALIELNRDEEAEALARLVLDSNTPDAQAYSSFLFLLAYYGLCSGEAMRSEALRWNFVVLGESSRRRASEKLPQRAPAAGRPLRVGVLSAEFGTHPVACFLNSWLWHLDPKRIDLHLYPIKQRDDSQADEFKRRAPHWTPLVGLSDDQAAKRLRTDELDVLIETSGHTKGNRLGIPARRVAPVQCHYIGYFASTGLTAMDYFIGDEVLIPAEYDSHFVEKVWRLPRTRYAYEPFDPCSAPSWQSDRNAQLSLGSFNNLAKVRRQSLALWARVLHALPHAKLLLKDRKANGPTVQMRILEALSEHGIPRERVSFFGRSASWSEHMALYNQVDIALDTVPFNSATTACDALWMGTPLVTLLGDQLAGRQAASILTGIGRGEWIARDADDYVAIVTDLAHDSEHRKRIRETQREQMRASELCDGQSLASALEASFEKMFDAIADPR